ncbi:hypothetical protein F442_13374 [Phytophthora nicotianae P10297]|uniref:ISXO2-like transposase domain-containing protein n=2 Tax=Phytophthora nicotianae TaxID=4792 RepID=W2YYW1_PHYNI|nr:hypothetical protein F442_13374 [Phytophthora nicotianae P10297]
MEATTDESKAVVWAMEVGLLGRSMLCPQCAQPMRLNARNRYWRCCRKTRHADGKQEQFSIFVNSWFSKMKLELSQALRLMFAWCMRTPQPQAAHMAKVSENTASAWYAACRVLCSKELLSGEFKIGGEGHIVEIDETSLKKKSKYGRGRTYQEFWLFGGVDRTTGRTRTLASMHYEHSWVNHTLHFVDPVSGTHTNTIEGLWEMHIKCHITAMRGCSKKYLDGYIDEYMWRSWFFPTMASPGEFMCGLVQAVQRHPQQEE